MSDADEEDVVVEEFEGFPAALERVDAGPLPPPLDPAVDTLPFGRLPWEAFESLTLRLVREREDVRQTARYGTRGQKQLGIDVYAWRADGTYATYQCKRYAELFPGDIKAAVDKFVESKWARTSAVFVLCTSHSVEKTSLVDAIEEQRLRLARREPSVEFEVWDANEMALVLKGHPELVADAFSQGWAEAFCPGYVQKNLLAEMGAGFEGVQARLDKLEQQPVRFVSLSWARPSLRTALDRYKLVRPRVLEKLVESLGEEFSAERTEGLISVPPAWLDTAIDSDWEFIAEVAEARSLWPAASIAWERAAGLSREDCAKAGYLASASATAGIAGSEERRGGLMGAAERLCPAHPRVVVIGMSPDLDPEEQLKLLDGTDPQSDDDLALVQAQRALAYMRLGRLAIARACVDEVEAFTSNSLTAQSLSLCWEVQKGRISLTETVALESGGLVRAAERGEELRQELLAASRFEEAARTLMLAVDGHALLAAREQAESLLRSATPEELSAPNGAVVLGHCAMRWLFHQTALELISEGDGEDADVRLIRAVAMLDVGTAEEKVAALAELDELLESKTYSGTEAAFFRLEATVATDLPWSEEAERVVVEAGYERQALAMKAYRASEGERRPDQARAVLGAHADEPWAQVLLFRCTRGQDDHALTREAALAALNVAPPQHVRVEIGRALAKGRYFDEAYPVLIQVARDANASLHARCDAYFILVGSVGLEQRKWKLAGTLFDEWLLLHPADVRLNFVAPTVQARRRDKDA